MKNNGFLSLCYHYIREKKQNESFSRILGTEISEFKNQMKMLSENFQILDLEQIENFSKKEMKLNKTGMLITFDDGLSDHYTAAKILHELDIRGVFFIPTCILENEPANPMIIHYCIARYGVEKFVNEYENLRIKHDIPSNFRLTYNKQHDNPWKKIDSIKKLFKYQLSNKKSRQVLLDIFENTLKRDYSNPVEIIHLTKNQIDEIVQMGHSIGVHTHTHISIAPSKLSSQEFEYEIKKPKELLENTFKTKVFSMSFPFGEKQDCLTSAELFEKTNLFQFAFTVDPILNTNNINPLQYGRYQPQSKENTEDLKQFLDTLVR